MSEDTMIKRMDKSAFFDSVTWLNQENWQKFFGKSLPNGILVDHALKLDTTGYRIADMMDLVEGDSSLTIGNGSVMANGLYSEILTPVTITNVTETEKTKFIVVRYDSDNSYASIVQKVDVLTEDNISVTNAIRNFMVDESFLCTRNESIYEIPIAFQYYSGGAQTVDLRHFVYAPSGMKRVLNLETDSGFTNVKLGVLRGNSYAQLIGGTSYTISIQATDTSEYFDIYPMVVNSNEPITLFIRNGSGTVKKLNLKQNFGNYTVGYEWIDAWTVNTHGVNISLAIASSMVVRLDVVKQTSDTTVYSVTTKSLGSGGGVDPATVYTKAEIDNMLAVKANNSVVNQQLAVKENIANLKSLAYKDKVNYETEVTNKPTWNSVAKQYFYVDGNNGNDGNSGDQGSPFKTIQKAIDSVNINSVGEITIASGTYTEKIIIDGKNIILKQKELPEESTGTAFNSKIIIDMYSGRTANEDYIIDITNNSFVKIIGFFTIKGYYHGIQISDNSTVVFTGNVGSLYCKLILELKRRQSYNNDVGISICNGSQFITEKSNSVDISDVYRGYFLDKSYCFVYEANFTNIAKYVLARGCYFCYNTSNQQLINTTATENVVQSFDFGTLAYKNDVSNNDKSYVRKNGAWTELVSELPTFGALALKDSVDYETEVTNKPTLGALASKDTADYETEVTNKPIFGALALKDIVDYETEVTNKPTLGTLASKDTADYSDIIFPTTYHPNTYYVSTDGNDSNAGTQSNPFKTIQYAVNKIGPLGGKIYITPGTYGAVNVDNKSIDFYVSYDGKVTIKGGANSLRINNGSVVNFRNGTWEFSDSTYEYGQNTIVDILCSTVIFSSDVSVSETNMQTQQIKINNASKVVFNNLSLHSSHESVYGILLYKASSCYIDDLSVDGAYSNLFPTLQANGGTIMYRSSNTTNYFKKSNGGLILTGADN